MRRPAVLAAVAGVIFVIALVAAFSFPRHAACGPMSHLVIIEGGAGRTAECRETRPELTPGSMLMADRQGIRIAIGVVGVTLAGSIAILAATDHRRTRIATAGGYGSAPEKTGFSAK